MRKIILIIFLVLFNFKSVFAEKIGEVKIFGNDRIPKETILMFANIKKNDVIDDNKANIILKNLYESNFFEDVSIKYENKVLIITVKELPIIEKITIEGIEAKKFEEQIRESFKFKPRYLLIKFF